MTILYFEYLFFVVVVNYEYFMISGFQCGFQGSSKIECSDIYNIYNFCLFLWINLHIQNGQRSIYSCID